VVVIFLQTQYVPRILLSITSRYSIETAEWIEVVGTKVRFIFGFLHFVIGPKGIQVSPKIKVLLSEPCSKRFFLLFRHGKSTVASILRFSLESFSHRAAAFVDSDWPRRRTWCGSSATAATRPLVFLSVHWSRHSDAEIDISR